MTKILNHQAASLCLINKRKKQPEKDFKGRIANGLLKEVSSGIFGRDCFAFQPFYKLSREMVTVWKTEVERFVARGIKQVYAENALNQILDRIEIKAISYANDYVAEVDDIDDYNKVAEEIRYYDFREQPIYDSDNRSDARSGDTCSGD